VSKSGVAPNGAKLRGKTPGNRTNKPDRLHEKRVRRPARGEHGFERAARTKMSKLLGGRCSPEKKKKKNAEEPTVMLPKWGKKKGPDGGGRLGGGRNGIQKIFGHPYKKGLKGRRRISSAGTKKGNRRETAEKDPLPKIKTKKVSIVFRSVE